MRSKYPHLTFGFPPEREARRYYGGDDPPPQQSTTTVNQLYSPEEAARRAALMAQAEQIYKQQSAALPGLKPGGPSADTLEAQKRMKALAGTGGPLEQLNANLMNATNWGLTKAIDPANDPGFQGVLSGALRQVENKYTDPGGVMSQIRGNFTAGNSGGASTREGIASGIAGREYLNTVGDVTSRMYSDAYGKGLDTFARTMALAPQNASMLMQPANLISAVGAQNEAYDERRRMWEAESPWMAFNPYASAVMGMSNPSTQTTATAPGAQKNPMAPLGMAMMGATLGSAFGPPGSMMGTMVGAGAGLVLGLFD